jgi:membrane protease YdiL (CAAX protease family)
LQRRLPLFVLGTLVAALLSSELQPAQWFHWPRRQTTNWWLWLIAYPLLSVWPQELIYRTFLFHRYKRIMPSKLVRGVASTVLFGYAHIVYANGIAMALALIGGALFSYTYVRTRSTLTCVVEHSLWGLTLFTLGLGDYLSSR